MFLGGVGPEFAADALMQMLGKSFGQPVGQRLHHDLGIIVIRALETRSNRILAKSRGHREAAHIVGRPAFRRDKISERGIGAGAVAAADLLAKRM